MVTDINGKIYNLDALKGKKVLLHFWSTSCAPCIKEIPELVTLNENRSDLVIINVSLDTEEDRWKKGVLRLGMSGMINVCDLLGLRGQLVMDYFINALPSNYLISAEGKIIAKKQSLEEILKVLD